jgi:hypothetical protein
MKHPIRKVSGLMAALAMAGLSTAHATTAMDGNPTLSTGQQKVATKFASPFATLTGSQENAVALATALRTGTPATLTYTTIVDGKPVTVTETITPPTKPMGWGNVSHALALAQFSLTKAGITQPTAADLQAALLGGRITASDGNVVTLDGVLTQRASGMGWGQIAHSEGTTMGAVNHGLKSPTTGGANPAPLTEQIATTGSKAGATTAAGLSRGASGMTTAGGASISTAHGKGVVTAGGGAGSGSKGITTAGGVSAGGNGGSKGLTTAGGAPAGNNAGGKGLTTAGGATSGSGIVTASGRHGAGNGAAHGVVTANGGGGGPPIDHGKGKGGG